jgi:hypothetical protein
MTREFRKCEAIKGGYRWASGWLIVAAIVLFGISAQSQAQSPTANDDQGIAGTWQGTLHAGKDYRDVVKISKADDGGYKAVFYLPDQSGDGYTASKVMVDGPTLKMTLPFGMYTGKLSPDGKTFRGTWTQGSNSLPLIFTRATPETEWTIRPPSPKIPPMDANANPAFEVATNIARSQHPKSVRSPRPALKVALILIL